MNSLLYAEGCFDMHNVWEANDLLDFLTELDMNSFH